MITVFPCYAPADKAIAAELAAFLEAGADIRVFLEDGEIGAGETLVSKAVDGMQADVILLILSPDSRPPKWIRADWEPAMRDEPREAGVKVGAVLLRECEFPALLRRDTFFDLTRDHLPGCREIKRWLQPEFQPIFEPAYQPPLQGRDAELEQLYRALADTPGSLTVAAPAGKKLALEFARRAQRDFEATVWVHCGGESLAAIIGEMGAQLGMTLAGDTESNLRHLLVFCALRRLLIVLDEAPADFDRLIAGGHSSTLLISADPMPPQAYGAESLSPCGASPFRQWLAPPLEGLVESGAVIRLDARFYTLASGARLEPSEQQSRAHAQAVARHFAGWAQPETDCAADLPQLRRALRWALQQEEDDGDAWRIACELARRGGALLKQKRRQAEAFELLEAVAEAAILRDDCRMLEDCSRDQVWILESWDRWEEAEGLRRQRSVLYEDQLSLNFLE